MEEKISQEEMLRKEGYGWKRVAVMCSCGWKGRRVWGMKMFDKPCPKCKIAHQHEGRQITTVYCPVRKVK